MKEFKIKVTTEKERDFVIEKLESLGYVKHEAYSDHHLKPVIAIVEGSKIIDCMENSGHYYATGAMTSLLELINMKKKKIKTKWYAVIFHIKGNRRPERSKSMYESLEDFYEASGVKKERLYFAQLTRACVEHEYEN